ncbi:MAG: hypothetical protein KGJ09_09300 [Candidatus Omnitrophica bacterium]|nr:hypothetical protein [Candidatus Omnitrophota bacterium]
MDWIKSPELIDEAKEYLVMLLPPIGETFYSSAREGIMIFPGRFIKKEFPKGSFVALEITLPKSLEECR